MTHNYHRSIILSCLIFLLSFHLTGQNLSVGIEPIRDDYPIGETIEITATLHDFMPENPNYLHCWVDATGYRKLKLGNNPDNYYNPPLDVISDGNDMLQITMRVNDLKTKWKKMLIRPNGAANPIRLDDYLTNEPAVGEWFTIYIPVVDFEGVSDFTQLRNIEFPYSGGANHFDWDIYSMVFTGGDTPVTWLGPGNIQNAHNGNGGPGEVFADWNLNLMNGQEVLPELRLLANDQLIEKFWGYHKQFTYLTDQTGPINFEIQAYDGLDWLNHSFVEISVINPNTPDIGISLTSPLANEKFESNEPVQVKAELINMETGQAYLQVHGIQDGWRKLKTGNNPDNLYGPEVDVTYSGHNTLNIILRDSENTVDWSKIDIRPNGNTTNPITIEPYWNSRTIYQDDWCQISIPLSDFDNSIDFQSLSHIEFPYSKGANYFEIDILEMSFSGGAEMFLWLGEEKMDAIHDGYGNAGQLLAEWIQPDQGDYSSLTAELWTDNQLYSTDNEMPFEWTLPNPDVGNHSIYVVLLTDQNSIKSETQSFEVVETLLSSPEINFDPFYNLSEIPQDKQFALTGEVLNIPDGVSIETILFIDDVEQARSSDVRFDFLLTFPNPGNSTWFVKVITSAGVESLAGPFDMSVIDPQSDPNLSIINPESGSTYLAGQTVEAQLAYTPDQNGSAPFMEVTNPGSGYRKLKIGNNPDNLYSPQVNLIGSGNTHMEIEIKLIEGTPNLSALVVCPQEITANAPNLETYWNQAEDLDNGWKRVSIPLSDFDSSIDFSQIGYIAFPYSRDAGYFKFGIREISFTGSEKILYFGEGHMDNVNDGYGNPGQLSVNILPNGEQVLPGKYLLFVGDLYAGMISDPNEILSVKLNQTGNQTFEPYCISSSDEIMAGNAIQVNVVNQIPDSESIQFKIILDESLPLDLDKATLRYNKQFAYSLTLDDGLADAYDHAYQILNGGYISENGKTYSGLSFTDGCGNDISFTAGMAWFSVSSNLNDLHIETPSYVTWTELVELYNSGWDVLNHSYSHAYESNTDFFWQIDQNQQIVLNKTGIEMTQFIIPGGGDYVPYQQEALNYGMNAIYAYKSNFEGFPKGLSVDQPQNWIGKSIYRGYKYDSYYNPTNIMNTISNIAASASESNHVWYNDFTHRVHLTETGGSLRVETFEYYMTEIERQFGKTGTDEIWMAPLQQVWEYLFVRDNTVILTETLENEVIVTIDVSQIPSNLRTKAMSLIASTDANYAVESLTPGVTVTHNSQTGLINLEWDKKQAQLKSGEFENQANQTGFDLEYYPNPVSDYLFIRIKSDDPNAQIEIYSLNGQIIYNKKLSGISHGTNLIINRSEIDSEDGIYFLRVSSGTNSKTEKIVLQ